MLYFIKLDKLSSHNHIGDFINFFHLLSKTFNNFLIDKYTIEHTRQMTFIGDRLWFDNDLHYLSNVKMHFREFDLQTRNLLIINQFKSERIFHSHNNVFEIFEINLENQLFNGYAFKMKYYDELLHRFLSLHDFINLVEIDHNQYDMESLMEIKLNGINDVPLYDLDKEPSTVDRLQKMACYVILKKFQHLPLNQVFEMYEKVYKFDFPKLNELFIKINDIMEFSITNDEINSLFQKERGFDKRKLKFNWRK